MDVFLKQVESATFYTCCGIEWDYHLDGDIEGSLICQTRADLEHEVDDERDRPRPFFLKLEDRPEEDGVWNSTTTRGPLYLVIHNDECEEALSTTSSSAVPILTNRTLCDFDKHSILHVRPCFEYRYGSDGEWDAKSPCCQARVLCLKATLIENHEIN